MTEPFKVLFLCSDNSCRSPMAQALMNHKGQGKIIAFSAGPKPAGQIHNTVVEVLKRHGIAPTDLLSKSWNNYSTVRFDLVVTLCGQADKETYPVFPGRPQSVFWDIPNPLRASETGIDAFEEVFAKLNERIDGVINSLTQRPLTAQVVAKDS